MDTLMFPVVEKIDYQVLSARQWKLLSSKLGGISIKRFPVNDEKYANRLSTDTLVKMIL